MSKAIEITDSNFDDLILKARKPALVLFWAEWSGNSRALKPDVDDLANTYDGKAVIGAFDLAMNPQMQIEHTITTAPTVLIFSKGAEVQRFTATNKAILNKALIAAIDE
jgi:thioredoxin 1